LVSTAPRLSPARKRRAAVAPQDVVDEKAMHAAVAVGQRVDVDKGEGC
jgi:hypothetical protein